MTPRQTIAESDNPVRAQRRVQGITQADLAAQAQVSRQTIIAIEQGDYAPSVYLAIRIARLLGASVEDLFIEDETKGGQK